ncbi:hypothetical protein RND81_09G025400 [Saponaria officinalis]|uniref:Band 7 domain-containing protein n=1 Tax=Saponaria officinalis TaxID=3572 RepID=A0AAW1IGA0_SAPOF
MVYCLSRYFTLLVVLFRHISLVTAFAYIFNDLQVIDAERASYGNDNVMYAVTQLAQTVMRSAIGKMPLDKTFMERDTLNANIVEAINDVATQWGLICCRYEIRDIIPPPGIRDSMVMQAEAERRKRAEIIEAEGKRQAVILTSEAAKMNSINRATAICRLQALKWRRTMCKHLTKWPRRLQQCCFLHQLGDPSSMVASALALYKNLIVDKHGKNLFQENSIPAKSARQIEHDEATESREKPVFSLQSTKKD